MLKLSKKLIMLSLLLLVSLLFTRGIQVQAEDNKFVFNIFEKEEDLSSDLELNNVEFAEGVTEIIAPIDVAAKGALSITLGEKVTTFSSLTATLYEDAGCTTKIGTTVYLFKEENEKTKIVNISSKGTYYLKLELSRKYDHKEAISFSLQLDFVDGSDKTLKDKQTYVAYQDYDSEDRLYKITTTETGLISFILSTPGVEDRNSVKFQLLDSKKKKISEEVYVYSVKEKDETYGNVTNYYSVAKGTYYVKIDASCGLHTVKYTFTKVDDKSGTKLSKAKALKLGGTATKGICTTTDKVSKIDWFKFVLNKKKSVVITIASKIDGKLIVEICDSNNKTLWYGTKTLYEGVNTITLESDGDFSKGTYYLKIHKRDVTSSGYYTIKVK